MAYTSGTAANYKDLLSVLASFAAANGWTILEQTTDKLCLKGSGLAGIDEIYAGIETYEDQANNYYNWSMAGAWYWRPGRTLDGLPRSSREGNNNYVIAHFWNQAIPYWAVATPRRIILVAKVSTTYQHVHLGLLTPAGTDAQYPYPLFIGGGKGGANTVLKTNFSGTLGAYWSNEGVANASGRIVFPNGNWGVLSSTNSEANPSAQVLTVNEANRTAMLTAVDGSYLLEPLYVSACNCIGILGAFDGLYRVSGYNNSSENIVTVDGVNHMVFQNGSRTGYGDYCALRMN